MKVLSGSEDEQRKPTKVSMVQERNPQMDSRSSFRGYLHLVSWSG